MLTPHLAENSYYIRSKCEKKK